jgi:hypothetical protein
MTRELRNDLARRLPLALRAFLRGLEYVVSDIECGAHESDDSASYQRMFGSMTVIIA